MQRVNNFKGITVLLFLISFSTVVAQSKVKVILNSYKKTVEKDKEYQVNLTYKIYKGYSETLPYEVQEGVFYKKMNNSYTSLSNVEIINTENTYLKINHNEKAILIANGVKKPQELHLNLDELFKYLEAEIIKENPKFWTIKFTPRGEITQLPFSKLIIELNKKTFRVKRQLFYYLNKMNFSENLRETDEANVKLEVLFKNYKTSHFKKLIGVFDIKKYIKKEKGIYKPKGAIGGYEVVNLKTNKDL
ncbi:MULTISPECIES: hypothetical protein [Flavobacteriaceae]|uniref:hypothetical protein n=1 Tax=Flavobacteriaceae TaxID=49546 RepID=UPI0039E73540